MTGSFPEYVETRPNIWPWTYFWPQFPPFCFTQFFCFRWNTSLNLQILYFDKNLCAINSYTSYFEGKLLFETADASQVNMWCQFHTRTVSLDVTIRSNSSSLTGHPSVTPFQNHRRRCRTSPTPVLVTSPKTETGACQSRSSSVDRWRSPSFVLTLLLSRGINVGDKRHTENSRLVTQFSKSSRRVN